MRLVRALVTIRNFLKEYRLLSNNGTWSDRSGDNFFRDGHGCVQANVSHAKKTSLFELCSLLEQSKIPFGSDSLTMMGLGRLMLLGWLATSSLAFYPTRPGRVSTVLNLRIPFLGRNREPKVIEQAPTIAPGATLPEGVDVEVLVKTEEGTKSEVQSLVEAMGGPGKRLLIGRCQSASKL